MDIAKIVKNFKIKDEVEVKYKYINVFKNPNKLPINQIHLEKNVVTLRQMILKNIDITELSDNEAFKKFVEQQKEIIPALDKRWLPKCVLYPFEPYVFTLPPEENKTFLSSNLLYSRSLDYLLKCNYHQFWCTILYEPTAAICLRSFILNPISNFQCSYLEGDDLLLFREILDKYLLVYQRLLNFKATETEYMPSEYGLKLIIDVKLLNLPIVITLAFLYKDINLTFVNKLTNLYFNNTSQLDFQIKEMEEILKQAVMIMEMIGGNICGFDKDAVVVPLSIEKRPAIFSLSWVYSVVNYLLYTISTVNVLFEFYKPSIEMALNLDLPYRMPYTYVNVYRELYEMLYDRPEIEAEKELSRRIFDEINLGRSQFIDMYHVFISYCLDKALESMGDSKQQEELVEIYLKLLTTALEDDYFICDYDLKYNVSNMNEVFESCTPIDPTRTQFISSCLQKHSRHKKLEKITKLSRKTIEDVFKEFKPIEKEPELQFTLPPPVEVKQTSQGPSDNKIEQLIKDIIDMFPHLGDGFVLKCLEAYNFNSSDVINAILEENLPPHLYEIAFDTIRIPPEPEPEKPILAFKGKKPGYDDALKLLNDKSDMKEIKTYVLEGVQYSIDNSYDDEYDDRYDELDPIKVDDGPLSEERTTFNPNRDDLASDTSYSSEEEYDDQGKSVDPKNKNFCEDPALVRARREQRFLSKNPHLSQPKKKDVVGNAKGQGQDKTVLQNRQKKNTNKSSKANHSRKSGAQFKRNKGMIPS
ncbi:unnamed protein product [Brassicogethes aeneus]|uniref:CUE domain-containing protein n=1 Tax=Brassicogethes aeneus TaxID=1431903 RepID=A0A9P0BHA5_BRAAE|nr:unnamed protein product [Brassicogethes aeneus]